jgi:hypothetical protein
MFVFLDTLTKIQATTYIKIRSTSSEAARSRHDYEKENFAMEKYQTFICAIVINLLFYFKDIYFKETNLMTSLLFYPGIGPAVLTLAELKSFIIKYDKLKR